MPGSACGEEKQRIFFPHGIGFLNLTEQAGRIAELRLEPSADFFSDLVATALNSRADGGLQVAGMAAEAAHHFSNAFLNDALDGATPTSVEDADCMALRVHYDHGQ